MNKQCCITNFCNLSGGTCISNLVPDSLLDWSSSKYIPFSNSSQQVPRTSNIKENYVHNVVQWPSRSYFLRAIIALEFQRRNATCDYHNNTYNCFVHDTYFWWIDDASAEIPQG